jgi:hypothetical protein
MSHSSTASEGNDGFRGRAISEYGSLSSISFQAFGGRFQLREGSLDATNVLVRVSDGFLGLANQLGYPIRLGQIGTFRFFELISASGWPLESSVGMFRLAARLASSYPEISGIFTSMIARSKPTVSIACKTRLPVRSRLTVAES